MALFKFPLNPYIADCIIVFGSDAVKYNEKHLKNEYSEVFVGNKLLFLSYLILAILGLYRE